MFFVLYFRVIRIESVIFVMQMLSQSKSQCNWYRDYDDDIYVLKVVCFLMFWYIVVGVFVIVEMLYSFDFFVFVGVGEQVCVFINIFFCYGDWI